MNAADRLDIIPFKSTSEVNRYVDDEISKLSDSLSNHLKRLEVVHERAEKIKKTREMIMKLVANPENPDRIEGRQADLGGVKVLLNATADQEESVLQRVTSSMKARLQALEEVKRTLEPLAGIQDGSTVNGMIIIENGIPIGLIINFDRAWSPEDRQV